MTTKEFIQRRKGRYMAQILEDFDERIIPKLPESSAGDIQSFKGLVRARLNTLATDAIEAMELGPEGEIGDLAQQARDRMSPVGRP